MGPRVRHGTAWIGWLVLAGCGGGSGGTDVGARDDTARPDIIIVIPETNPGVDLGGPDDLGKTSDDPSGEEEILADAAPDEAAGVPDDTGAVTDDRSDAGEEPTEDLASGVEAGDVGWSCEVDGNPCDDGDPCTADDRCLDGACRGKPIVCLDDGIPCTEDRCEGGACVHPIKPANCLIAKKCYKDGDVSLQNSCRYCNAAKDPLDWTPATGWTCSDDDPCTDGDHCENGVCVSGVNTCIPPECTYHADCYPERVCAPWYVTGKTHCSVPCTGPADCDSGRICTHLPGASGVGYCQTGPSPSGGEFGVPCQAGAQCGSTLCVLGVCGSFCAGQSACDAGTCFPAGDGTTTVLGACAPNSVYLLGLPFDFACTKDAGKTYDSSLCLSGHCDLMASQPTCTRLCVTDSQCKNGQECNIILFSTQAVADSVPFAAEFTEKTHDGVLGCYSVGTGGYKSVGQECSGPQECKTNKCFALTPGNPKKTCTTFCGSDAHCPTGWQCKPELVTLSDAWLQQPFSQDPRPDGYTLIRLCKPK